MQCYLMWICIIGIFSSLYIQAVLHCVTAAGEYQTESDSILKSLPTTSALIENRTTVELQPIIGMQQKNGTTFNPYPVDGNLNSTNSLPYWMRTIESGALQRTGYVVLGFMSIILIFFAVRSIRIHHKKSKSRKYGIITSTASEMEMEPLDNDDEEEEEMTLFDAQHKYSLK